MARSGIAIPFDVSYSYGKIAQELSTLSRGSFLPQTD
jgi:hypothetical protein